MSATDASNQAVVCPGCNRRVPRKIPVCRCGFRLGAVYGGDLQPAAAVDEPESRSGRWIPVVVITVGLTLAGAGIWYTSQRRSQLQDASAPAAASPTAAATPGLQAGSPAPQPLSAVPPRPTLTGTEEPRTPGTPGTPPGTLEEVISQAMPAVVSIETTTARGTGFFIQPGLVVTNAHVVETNSSVTVRLTSGRPINGRVNTVSPENDLALVRIDPAPADQTVLRPRSAHDVRVGQEVIAIGSALGVLQNTVTRGIISAVRRAGTVVLLQTDAAINPGNSGGPLLDRSGLVIGVTTMKVGQSAESIGFAVAIDHALPLIEGKQPQPSTSSTPLLPPQPLRPSAPSQIEDAREAGVRAFDRAMQVAGQRADDIDNAWATFRKRCSPRARAGTGDREWFGVWDDRGVLVSPAGDCAVWLDEITQAAGQFRSAMMAADELARRAEVYPGVRRDIRRRYRLDWTGWER
jgi:S1-C subfamily serine protease